MKKILAIILFVVVGALPIFAEAETIINGELSSGSSGTGDLLANGTVPLTANWDVGAFTITALSYVSDVATGTAPFTVSSTTRVANLNAATAGNADTATTLATARTIGGVSFDGSANINLPGVNAAGNQDTSGKAATAGNADTVTTITGLAPDTATTAATQPNITTAANLVTVGALDSGSITSGFGAINIGADDFTTTGTMYAGSFEASASALPNLTFNDTNMPGSDKIVGNIYGNYLSGVEDSEESGLYFQIKDGGSDTTVLTLTGELAAVTGSISSSAAFVPNAADGATVGTAALEISDIFLADEGTIQFGDDQDVTLTHVPDTGLSLSGDLSISGAITAKPTFTTDSSGGITLTVNAVNYGTDTGDADIPDGACDDAGDVGNWVVLISSAADAYALTSNDASNQFIITDNASALDAGNELDVDGTMVSVVCIAAELWKVTGYMGAIPTDGGAAD